MAMPREPNTGSLHVLEALHAKLDGLAQHLQNTNPGSGEFDADLRDKFDEHVKTEHLWQRDVDLKLDRLINGVDDIRSDKNDIADKVKEHEGYILQAKGAVLATRITYAIGAGLVGVVIWLAGNMWSLKDIKISQTNAANAAPSPVAVHHVPEYVYYPPDPAYSAYRPAPSASATTRPGSTAVGGSHP